MTRAKAVITKFVKLIRCPHCKEWTCDGTNCEESEES